MNEPKFKSNEPAVNWLCSVLIDNVGWNEWVPKTKEEKKQFKKDNPGLPASAYEYPYKVISHPIPEGTTIVLKDSNKYVIECNNEDIRDMLIGMAERYEHFQKEYYRIKQDEKPWHPASEAPDSMNSSCRCRLVHVDSSALRYVNSFHTGYHDYRNNKWYVFIRGKAVEHAVEQWRRLPHPPGDTDEYQTVKTEAERLRLFMEKNQITNPSFSAIIENRPVEFDSIDAKIDALEEWWREYNDGKSMVDYNHFAYFQIIGLGSSALPSLLKRVRDGSNSWFVALKAITGFSADTKDMKGKPQEARQAWIKWYDTRGNE